MQVRTTSSRVLRAVCRASLIAALATSLVAGTAFAAKGGQGRSGSGSGGGGSSGTLDLVMVRDFNANGLPNRADYITFNVSTTSTDRPFVGLRCWQGTSWVYDGYVGYFPTYMFDPWFVLSSPYWAPSDEASCTARLFYYNKRGGENLLKTISFLVAP